MFLVVRSIPSCNSFAKEMIINYKNKDNNQNKR